MQDFVEMLTAHQSIRRYQDKPVPEQVVREIIRAGQWSSTSSNFQAYTIIEIKDPQKREAVAEVAGNQKWVVSCPLFLMFCADLHRGEKYWKVEDKTIFHNTEMFLVASIDAALAAQQTYLAASALGLGGVYVGGIRDDVNELKKLLNLPDLVYPVFGMCLGYPDENPGQKPRLDLKAVYKVDSYDESMDDELAAEYDERTAQYYLARTGGRESETWSERCGRLAMKKPRENLGPDLQGMGFNRK